MEDQETVYSTEKLAVKLTTHHGLLKTRIEKVIKELDRTKNPIADDYKIEIATQTYRNRSYQCYKLNRAAYLLILAREPNERALKLLLKELAIDRQAQQEAA